MWVVKIGGSLQYSNELEKWLAVLVKHCAGQVVIVPGGGKFTDMVREAQAHWSFNDQTAHRMALLGMHQYGLMMTGLNPGIRTADAVESMIQGQKKNQVWVWLPDFSILQKQGIPETWAVTSDSLAAWLAKELNAEKLILVKSAQIEPSHMSSDDPIMYELVDPSFRDFICKASFKTLIYGATQQECFAKSLTDPISLQDCVIS